MASHLIAQAQQLSRPDFRSDINGLRAWAVVAVILYHFGIPGFGGGFIGVDVFFVISGFLMTGIVVKGLEQGRFSLLGFYLARARRILPALVGLCVVLLILGWWTLTPIDYKTLGAQTVYSLAFVSNINYWLESGYFDAASHEKWLLHTWSLAVEWQFYLLLPLGLMGLWKLRPKRKTLLIVVAVVLLASLLGSVLWTLSDSSAAFFLLPTRAWELLAGGMVFLTAKTKANPFVLSPRLRTTLEVAGIGLIIFSALFFDSSTAWPGWRALVPVMGAVLVLVAARSSSWLTGNAVAQWLGTRSYSLYLWHWPIVVALVFYELWANPGAIATGLVLTLILGHFSYRLVETTALQALGKLKPMRAWVAVLGITLAAAAPGASVRLDYGVPQRFAPELAKKMAAIDKEKGNNNPRLGTCLPNRGGQSPSCMYGGSSLRVILMGDSHADAVVSALAAAAPQTDYGVMEWSYTGCPIIQGTHSARTPDKQCSAFVDWALQHLEKQARNIPVVIVNRHAAYALGRNEFSVEKKSPGVFFSRPYATPEPAFLREYAQHLTATACQMAKDRPVYLVRPFPEMGVDVPKTMARAAMHGKFEDMSISLAEYHQRQGFIWAAQDAARDQCGVKILDPLPYLCHDGRCYGAKEGRPLYFDDDHLSEFGNKLLVPMFATVFTSR
jgi:peptidoglycan/LPS O-acetylase OafA/YrhL